MNGVPAVVEWQLRRSAVPANRPLEDAADKWSHYVAAPPDRGLDARCGLAQESLVAGQDERAEAPSGGCVHGATVDLVTDLDDHRLPRGLRTASSAS